MSANILEGHHTVQRYVLNYAPPPKIHVEF